MITNMKVYEFIRVLVCVRVCVCVSVCECVCARVFACLLTCIYYNYLYTQQFWVPFSPIDHFSEVYNLIHFVLELINVSFEGIITTLK